MFMLPPFRESHCVAYDGDEGNHLPDGIEQQVDVRT